MQAMNIYAQYFEIEKGKYSIWGNMQNQCSDGWREEGGGVMYSLIMVSTFKVYFLDSR